MIAGADVIPLRPRAEIAAAVRSSPLLLDLPPDALEWFASAADVRHLTAGTIVFRLGEVGRELFVVASGAIEIVVPGKPGREEVLARLGPGDWFGEIAVLTGEGRSATARAATDVLLLAIDRETLGVLVGFAPAIAMRLSDRLSRRLRENTLRRCAPTRPRIVIVEGAPDEQGDDGSVARFAAELADEVGSSIVLFASETAAAGDDRVRRRRPASSVEEVIAASSNGALAVVRLDEGGSLDEAIRSLPAGRTTLAEVVAAARGSRDATPTALMTSPLRRLARRVLGRTVALVLGAGGAKGFCHIGAIQAFERAGVRFDLIVGTSIGVLIGGFAARPASGEELYLGFREIVQDFRRKVIDFRLLGPSLLRGRKKTSMLEANTLGRNLEDLPIPFHAVAADLRSARETVLSSGPLSRAMDAATAVPTIFPPVEIGPLRLVDGWMVNPLPADVATAEGASRIIAIDPSAAGHGAGPRLEPSRPPKGIVARIARKIDVGARIRIAMRAFDVSARDRAGAAKPLIDVCIEPPLARFASTDIRAYERIVDAGDRAASDAIPAILQALRAEG